MIPVISRGAELSPCRLYRYELSRTLPHGVGNCVFVMLNPSTADGLLDDPTIRRCLGFVDRWGFKHLVVVNLFAWRATHPRDMLKQMDPVGPEGDRWIMEACTGAHRVVCAWGANAARPIVRARADAVRSMLETTAGPDTPIYHLGLTTDGHPRHPLFLDGTTTPELWR